MSIKPGVKDALWMAAGAAILLAVVVVVFHFHDDRSPAEQLAAKAGRVDLVGRMQLALESGAEAEKSAVLAVTDEESQTYADQARAAMADVDRGRRDLAELLKTDGTQGERDALAHFSEVFAEVQRIDADLLALAVKNTNIKATALAFGPAADEVQKMNAALSRVVAANADSPDARKIALLACGAEIAVLRIQTLLPPHIAEESDAKMDALEAAMAKADEEIPRDLGGLAVLPGVAGSDFTAATSAYVKFTEFKNRILALSRENTNVRSLTMSLNQKQKAMRLCQDALAELRKRIEDEPVPGVTRGPWPRPR